MTTLNLKFGLERTTKGALKYSELNSKGAAINNMQESKIGTLYIRKSAFPDGVEPVAIKVTVEVDNGD